MAAILLSWLGPAAASGDQPAEFSRAGELLAAFGTDAPILAEFVDGAELSDHEAPLVWKYLYSIRRFSPAEQERLSRPAPAEDLDRGELYRLEGRVTGARAVELPAADARRLEINRYFECDVKLTRQEGRAATVLALDVPQAWKLGDPLDEPVTALGFYIKRGEADRLLFAAQRVRWHPAIPLGEFGMDMGLFDTVRPRLALAQATALERECFYQVLAAAGRAGADELARRTRGPASPVLPVLDRPSEHRGELLAWEAVVRNVLVVRIDPLEDAELAGRVGFDHYYQIEASLTPERPVRLDGRDMSQFPVVFCVRSLPEGFPVGEGLHETIRVPAFFFAHWVYDSQASLARRAEGERVSQFAPLVIGAEPLWLRAETPSGSLFGVAAAGLFVLALGGIWLGVWRSRRAARARRDARAWAPRPSLPPLD